VPDSVVEVIRTGIKPPTGALGRSMPALGEQMSDAEITALLAHRVVMEAITTLAAKRA
jgi:mono/diheme cytochrome c family protein